jgi:small subunit ribosomal protein S8
MVLNDNLASALSKIKNAEIRSKKEIIIFPYNNVIKKVLDIMNAHNYLGKYEEVEESKGNYLRLNLLGNINNCNVIKPRFSVKVADFEKYEKRFLPAKNIGILIISTNQGIMTHEEAKKKNLGGKLLAYVY